MSKKKKRKAPEVFVSEVKDGATRLAALRIVQAVAKSVRLNLERELYQRPEWILNEHNLAEANANLADLEPQVRELALDGFAELELKGPFHGIGIKVRTVFDYDRDDALEWAKVNMPAAVIESVDLPTLKAALKAMPEGKRPAWAQFNKEPYATIAADLQKHVDQAELVALLPSAEDLDVEVKAPKKYPRNWKRIREQVLERDGHLCTRCGMGEDDGRTLDVDHVWPVSLGGTHHLYNLRTLCREECHGLLQIRSIEELEDVGEMVLADAQA